MGGGGTGGFAHAHALEHGIEITELAPSDLADEVIPLLTLGGPAASYPLLVCLLQFRQGLYYILLTITLTGPMQLLLPYTSRLLLLADLTLVHV